MAGSPKAHCVRSSQQLSYQHHCIDRGEAVEYLCQSLLLCPMPGGSPPSGVLLRLQAREPDARWDSSFLNPVVERYSAGAGTGEASLARGSTAAATPAVLYLHQPGQTSDPPACATEIPKACLALAAQELELCNSPSEEGTHAV